jgi:hypothetical protein
MFASPNDYSVFFNAGANWTTALHVVADSNYYGFNNTNDDVVDFSEQFEIWNNLGMTPFGDSVYVDEAISPYDNSRQLYTKYDTTGFGGDHSVMILDSKTPIDGFGNALYTPVWVYMLGLGQTQADLELLNTESGITIYPNPAKDFITIEFLGTNEVEQLTIFDLYGRIIQVDSTLNNNSITLNTTRLNSGTYFIKLSSGDLLFQSKFIVQ